MPPDFFAQIILLSGFLLPKFTKKLSTESEKIKNLHNVLRGGAIRVIIIEMWIITKKFKNFTGEFEFCSKI